MKSPKALYQAQPVVYTCELACCPRCEAPLRECRYQSAAKTVQTLSRVVVIAQRPKWCVDGECAGYRCALPSAAWRQIAPRGGTYGYDVIAHIGWERQVHRQQFVRIHAGLSERVQISESEVRYLYRAQYLPLIACSERQGATELARLASTSGLLLCLDGLSPEGGEPQLWLVRELQTGRVVRSGWLAKQDTAAFVSFLRPVAAQGWPVVAVMSDKQAGLEAAVAEVFPKTRHAFCQIHYLRNAAEPVAEACEVMKVRLRKDIRERVGELVRQERLGESAGVLTVTGVIPSPLDTPGGPTPDRSVEPAEGEAPAAVEEQESLPDRNVGATTAAFPGVVKEAASAGETDPCAESAAGDSRERESIVQDILRRVRYLLTLKERPPFRLAGVEMFERLSEVLHCLEELGEHFAEPRLVRLQDGLRQALEGVRSEYNDLRLAGEWLRQIAAVLDPDGKAPRMGEAVRQELWECLEAARAQSAASARLGEFFERIHSVTRRYEGGLFHSYDVAGLPRTNNRSEGDFRDLNRRLLVTTGQKGLTRRLVQRDGAWELLNRPETLAKTTAAIARIPRDAFEEERKRLAAHRQRFRLHTRSDKRSAAQLSGLARRWRMLPRATTKP